MSMHRSASVFVIYIRIDAEVFRNPIAVTKSLGLYRQSSGEKSLGKGKRLDSGALPIQRFVLNPLWGLNCNAIR